MFIFIQTNTLHTKYLITIRVESVRDSVISYRTVCFVKHKVEMFIFVLKLT